MNYRRIHPRELDDALVRQWRALQASHAELAGPCFCPEFTIAVGAVREDARVVIIEDGGEVVGFLPVQLRDGVGYPIGGALSDFHGVIADPGTEWDSDQLIRAAGVSTWRFDHLLDWQNGFGSHVESSDVSPYMDLSGGYDEYAECVRAGGSKQILKTGTLRRKLERAHGELRYVARSDSSEAIESVLRWKADAYKQSREMFARDWTNGLIHSILDTDTPEFSGMCSALYVGDTLIAGHIGMRSATIWHYWFPAYDEAWSRFSPGLILLLMMAESAPAMGITRIDLGKGMSMYKERLMSGSTAICEGVVELPSVTTTLRRCWRRFEGVVRRSPLAPMVRTPVRLMRRLMTGSRYE